MINPGIYPKPIAFGGTDRPVNQNGFLGFYQFSTMSPTKGACTNTGSGQTIRFLETSAETGGVRVVAEITLAPTLRPEHDHVPWRATSMNSEG